MNEWISIDGLLPSNNFLPTKKLRRFSTFVRNRYIYTKFVKVLRNWLLPVCGIWVTRPPKVSLFSSDCDKSLPDPRASVQSLTNTPSLPLYSQPASGQTSSNFTILSHPIMCFSIFFGNIFQEV